MQGHGALEPIGAALAADGAVKRPWTGGAPRRHAAGLLAAAAMMAAVHGTALAASAPINAIGIENEYADVIAQIGGPYVHVTAMLSDPNTDPHTFEASPSIASAVAAADLIVENGVGYDAWADKIVGAAPKPGRKVINAQQVLGLPDSTPNPHLWFDPKTMPAVAKAIGEALAALDPAHADTFRANVDTFDASLKPWTDALAAFKSRHPDTPVAVTEPVADYMLQAAGASIRTPSSLENAAMNDTDPSPQDVSAQNALFNDHAVKAFLYNQQVTDELTQNFLALAKKNNVPVVGVYETMPTPGYTYQTWMEAEVRALDQAVTNGTSTEVLKAGTP